MKKLGIGYTGYINIKNKRTGTGGIFQSRYKAVMIEDNTQLMATFAYVHTNPVELIDSGWKDKKLKNRNKALMWLRKYKWSSYMDYLGRENFPEVVKTEFFMNYFGNKAKCIKAVEDWLLYGA